MDQIIQILKPTYKFTGNVTLLDFTSSIDSDINDGGLFGSGIYVVDACFQRKYDNVATGSWIPLQDTFMFDELPLYEVRKFIILAWFHLSCWQEFVNINFGSMF